MAQLCSRKKPYYGEPLTRSESSILELVKTGMTRKEMGRKLFVTEKTIAFHLTNIYIKLEVKGKNELICKSYRQIKDRFESTLPKGLFCPTCKRDF